jgi:integrase
MPLTQAGAIIRAKCHEHEPELDIALHTGLRRGEQYALAWDCVDLVRRQLTVLRSKNGEIRHVPLNSDAVTAFRTLYDKSSSAGPVFVSLRSDGLRNARHWFEGAVREAQIPDFTWHCLRHTFASRMVMAGVDLRTVQQLMGHKTIQMTCRYAHLAPEHQLAAVERLATKPTTATAIYGPTDTRTDTIAEPSHTPPPGRVQ